MNGNHTTKRPTTPTPAPAPTVVPVTPVKLDPPSVAPPSSGLAATTTTPAQTGSPSRTWVSSLQDSYILSMNNTTFLRYLFSYRSGCRVPCRPWEPNTRRIGLKSHYGKPMQLAHLNGESNVKIVLARWENFFFQSIGIGFKKEIDEISSCILQAQERRYQITRYIWKIGCIAIEWMNVLAIFHRQHHSTFFARFSLAFIYIGCALPNAYYDQISPFFDPLLKPALFFFF